MVYSQNGKNRLDSARCSYTVSCNPFSRCHMQLLGMLTEHSHNSFAFILVIHLGGGTVSVDIINLLWFQPTSFQRHLHTSLTTLSFWSRSSDMMTITGKTITDNLSKNLSTTIFGSRILF